MTKLYKKTFASSFGADLSPKNQINYSANTPRGLHVKFTWRVCWVNDLRKKGKVDTLLHTYGSSTHGQAPSTMVAAVVVEPTMGPVFTEIGLTDNIPRHGCPGSSLLF